MALTTTGGSVLEPCEREVPIALPGEVLVRVRACGVCETDLQIADGTLPPIEIAIVPGHEIVGVVEIVGDGVTDLRVGDRVGIPWLGYTCGACEYCASGRENLCRDARFTGYHMDGGFAEYVVADAAYIFKLPPAYADADAAPLLCAGATGFRAYRLAGSGPRLGLYGFGVSAQLIAQVALHQQREVYAFTGPGDEARQAFAREIGCVWTGAFSDAPPAPLDAAIVFASDGALVPEALSRVAPGGVVVCAAPHMSDVPSFPFRHLGAERVIRSVVNFTRDDVRDFLALAATMTINAHVHGYDLAGANTAFDDLREGRILGAAVLTVGA